MSETATEQAWQEVEENHYVDYPIHAFFDDCDIVIQDLETRQRVRMHKHNELLEWWMMKTELKGKS